MLLQRRPLAPRAETAWHSAINPQWAWVVFQSHRLVRGRCFDRHRVGVIVSTDGVAAPNPHSKSHVAGVKVCAACGVAGRSIAFRTTAPARPCLVRADFSGRKWFDKIGNPFRLKVMFRRCGGRNSPSSLRWFPLAYRPDEPHAARHGFSGTRPADFNFMRWLPWRG